VRVTRLISLVLLLQSRESMTASALAEALGVSERTVYRDVLTLADAGVPIYADKGRFGGYRLVAGYRTRLTGLSRSQAEALFLSGVPGPAGEMGLSELLEGARLKVLAALPPDMRDAHATAAQRFHLDAPNWFRQADPPALLADLARATWTDRVLAGRYRRGEKVVDRTLEPYGLVLKNGIWYVAARMPDARTGDGWRVFRADRFVTVTVTETTFDRDDTFDLAGFWAQRAAEFSRAILHDVVTVRLSGRGRKLLPHLVDPVAARDSLEGATEADADGWVTVRLGVETLDVAYSQLFGLGPEAEVLAPPKLRERMRAAARELAARYETPHEEQVPEA
jgi:predicted DNA-binding transcriptional regulator YafY